MSGLPGLDVSCRDLLGGNSRLYAHKARRKKIALVGVELTNSGPGPQRVHLGRAMLTAGDREHTVERPGVILRKLGEFTWDFFLFAILDMHPVFIITDLGLFLFGPIYNRRLRRQLRELTDADLVLPAGGVHTVVLGFRGVPAGTPCRVEIPFTTPENAERIACGGYG